LSSPNTRLAQLGVAAGLLAATLPAVGCRERADRPGGSPVAERSAVLQSRWLIPPEPSIDPPLAAPVAIAVDGARGRLLVLELQPPELRVYGLPGGDFIEALGREGDGPGEYRHPSDLALGAGGVVAVLSMSGRVSFWNPDATLAGIVQAGTGMATDIMAARADTFYVKADLFPPDDVSEFRVLTADTALTQSRFRDSGISGTEEPGRRFRNHAYAVAGTVWGDLLLSPPGRDYVILRVGSDGKLRQKIRRPEIPPLLRSEEEIERVRERVRKGFAAAGRPAPQNIPVPMYRSHVARLAVAADGYIWALTRRGDDSVAVVDCFAPDGSFFASYRLALSVSDLAVAEDSAYFLARGALDVPGIAVAPRPEVTDRESAIR
jgi:hypothetical protein